MKESVIMEKFLKPEKVVGENNKEFPVLFRKG